MWKKYGLTALLRDGNSSFPSRTARPTTPLTCDGDTEERRKIGIAWCDGNRKKKNGKFFNLPSLESRDDLKDNFLTICLRGITGNVRKGAVVDSYTLSLPQTK